MKTTIFFDLDDTLIHEGKTIGDRLAEVGALVTASHPIDANALVKFVRHHAYRRFNELQGDERWGTMIGIASYEVLYGEFAIGDAPLLKKLREEAPRFRQHVWIAALRDCGVEDPIVAQELANTFRDRVRFHPELFPEAIEVLTELKQRYRLGLITNGAPDVQREKAESAGLLPFFDSVVVSGEIGVGKPKKPVFTHGMQTLSARPSQCVMVGNSFERDVKGAIDADMHAVWLNLHNEEPPHGNVPFDVIANLRELPPLLKRMR